MRKRSSAAGERSEVEQTAVAGGLRTRRTGTSVAVVGIEDANGFSHDGARRPACSDFQPRPLAISGLGLHRYLGGPWEKLAIYPFRG